ncbi:hypothetical protein [Gordonia humi]|uniref:hypothetical protein n=1 Tax=Gordonia humi TaxID=686429 RepID=UPI00160EF56D|nr:hypothetical protein [Gordonia humi]
MRYRERPDHVCGVCDREFALDPKSEPFQLNDLRLLRLADKLRTDDQLKYTFEQLRYAAGRRTVGTDIRSGWRFAFWGTVGGLLIVTLVPGLPLAMGFVPSVFDVSEGTGVKWLFIVSACAIALSMIVNGVRRPWMIRNHRIALDGSLDDFADTVSNRWRTVYGTDVLGAVDERDATISGSPTPRYAVLCPDRSVLVCLSANHVALNRGLALLTDPDQVPPTIPVLVLHDASPAGLRFVADARRRFGSRAVDVGLSPRHALARRLWLREPQLSPDDVDALPTDLSDDERDWLGIGWWSPIAAVPPRKLIAAVDRAVDRFEPGTASAREIGFLTWPTAG